MFLCSDLNNMFLLMQIGNNLLVIVDHLPLLHFMVPAPLTWVYPLLQTKRVIPLSLCWVKTPLANLGMVHVFWLLLMLEFSRSAEYLKN